MSSLEKALPGVLIDLGGKTRILCLDQWAIASLQTEFGEDYLGKALARKINIADAINISWAMMLSHHEELDSFDPAVRYSARKTVSSWLKDKAVAAAVVEKIYTAILNSQIVKATIEEGEKAAAEKKEQETGSQTSPSPE